MFNEHLIFFQQKLQRQQDSKSVEEKAAKIKDWVSNKLQQVGVQFG